MFFLFRQRLLHMHSEQQHFSFFSRYSCLGKAMAIPQTMVYYSAHAVAAAHFLPLLFPTQSPTGGNAARVIAIILFFTIGLLAKPPMLKLSLYLLKVTFFREREGAFKSSISAFQKEWKRNDGLFLTPTHTTFPPIPTLRHDWLDKVASCCCVCVQVYIYV